MAKDTDRFDVRVSVEITKLAVRDGVAESVKFVRPTVEWNGMTLEQVELLEDLLGEGMMRLRQKTGGKVGK